MAFVQYNTVPVEVVELRRSQLQAHVPLPPEVPIFVVLPVQELNRDEHNVGLEHILVLDLLVGRFGDAL